MEEIGQEIGQEIRQENIEEDYIQEDYTPDDSLGIKSKNNNIIYYDGQDSIKNIFYEKLGYIPDRNYFCNELNNSSNIIYFMPNDIIDTIGRDGKYIMMIYGFTLDGIKTELTITGIDIFFDVRVPNNISKNAFETELKNLLMMEVSDSIIEDIEAYPIRGYNENKVPYKRIYNKNFEIKQLLDNKKKELTGKTTKYSPTPVASRARALFAARKAGKSQEEIKAAGIAAATSDTIGAYFGFLFSTNGTAV